MRVILVLILGLAAGATHAAPQRVVSINLCPDQLAIMMLDPDHLVSVSFLALDPALSNKVEEARAFHINNGAAEEAVHLNPDLILSGTLRQSERTRLLENLGYTIVRVRDAHSIAESLDVIEDLARTLGVPDRGKAVTAAMRDRLDRLGAADGGRPLRAVLLQPRGGTVGAGTLVDDVMRHAGLTNVAAELGITQAGTLGIEEIIAADPDLIILDADDDAGASLARTMLDHPALRHLKAREAVVRVPTRLWWCPGPWLLDAVEILRDAAEGISDLDGSASHP